MVISKDTMDSETREKLYGVIITMIFAAILVAIGPGLINFLAGGGDEATLYAGFTEFFQRFNDNLRYIVVTILGLFMMVAIAKLRVLVAPAERRPYGGADGLSDEESKNAGRRARQPHN